MGKRLFLFCRGADVLWFRSEGQLTDECLSEYSRAIRKYWAATGARAGIWGFSSVTDFTLTTELVRRLARQEPTLAEPSHPRVIVASDLVGFGLSRMFQLSGESARPTLHVVRTFEEALAMLNIQSSKFEPLE